MHSSQLEAFRSIIFIQLTDFLGHHNAPKTFLGHHDAPKTFLGHHDAPKTLGEEWCLF